MKQNNLWPSTKKSVLTIPQKIQQHTLYYYRNSSDVPKRGLEVPCKIRFTAKSEEIKKLKNLLQTSYVYELI